MNIRNGKSGVFFISGWMWRVALRMREMDDRAKAELCNILSSAQSSILQPLKKMQAGSLSFMLIKFETTHLH